MSFLLVGMFEMSVYYIIRVIRGICDCVCLFVHALKEKTTDLLTPNLVHISTMAGPRNALTLWSEGQRSQGYQVCCWCGYAGRYYCLLISVR